MIDVRGFHIMVTSTGKQPQVGPWAHDGETCPEIRHILGDLSQTCQSCYFVILHATDSGPLLATDLAERRWIQVQKSAHCWPF